MNESFLSKTLARIALLVVFCSLLAYLSPYINPKQFPLFAFFGLAFPLFFGLNIGFAIWGFFFRLRTLFISLLCILVGFYHVQGLVNFSVPLSETENSIKVMSFNAQYFRVLDFNKGLERIAAQDKQLALIKAENPDIVCVQEFTGDSKHATSQRARDFLKTELGMNRQANFHSVQIYSRQAALEESNVRYNSSYNGAVWADLSVKGSIIRVFNVHMQSIRFGTEDLETLEHIDQQKFKDKKTWKKAGNIASKLKKAYVKRAGQSKQLAELVEESPHPVILCGDFNDTPSSYSYRRLNLLLQDAFKRKGRGIGSTYNGPIPFQRIDYIMVSKDFKVQRYKTIKDSGSDHQAVIATVAIR